MLPHVGTRVTGRDARALASFLDHLRSEVDGGGARPRCRGMHRRPRSRPSSSPSTAGTSSSRPTPDSAWASPVDDLAPSAARRSVVRDRGRGRGRAEPAPAQVGRDRRSTFVLGRARSLRPRPGRPPGVGGAPDPPPGRGIRLADRREVQFAPPSDAPVAGLVRRAGLDRRRCAWRYRPLPHRIPLPPTRGSRDRVATGRRPRHDLKAPSRPRPGRGPWPARPVGIPSGFRRATRACGAGGPARHGRVLLVSGPPRSGRTNVLRVIATSIVAVGRARSSSSGESCAPWRRPSGHGGRIDPLGHLTRRTSTYSSLRGAETPDSPSWSTTPIFSTGDLSRVLR